MNLSAFVLVSLTMCLYTEWVITAAPNKLLSHKGDFIESNSRKEYRTQRRQRGGRVRRIKTIITNRSQSVAVPTECTRDTSNLISLTNQ